MRVLFVCTGNTCRSPMAEAVFRHELTKAGLDDVIQADSAGTASRRTGEPPDPRAQAMLREHGIDFAGIRSRSLTAADYSDFDLILAMDSGHFQYLTAHAQEGAGDRIRLFLEPVAEEGQQEVPDPYYGDMSDYKAAFDLIGPACFAWINKLRTGIADQTPEDM